MPTLTASLLRYSIIYANVDSFFTQIFYHYMQADIINAKGSNLYTPFFIRYERSYAVDVLDVSQLRCIFILKGLTSICYLDLLA